MAIDWLKYWNEFAQNKNAHQQVGRTKSNQPLDNEVIELIVAQIVSHLELKPSDILLDICCGNGMISQLLAKYCHTVIAVDISPQQIALAQQFHASENIQYRVGDATKISEVIDSQVDKINLYFSFQYLDTMEKGEKALAEMQKCLLPSGKIFLGDVPEKEKWGIFYASFQSKIRYFYEELRGKNQMGKFWHYKEMQQIALKAGFSIEKITQSKDLPYSHYRCDYRLKRANLKLHFT